MPGKPPWDHEGHHPVQHRDGKPPWCNACGWPSPDPLVVAVAESERLRLLLTGAANVIEAVRTLLVDRHQLYAQAVAAGQIPPGAPELIRIDEVMAVLVAGASVGLDEAPAVTTEGPRE
jgi:hypothetical protein